MSNLLIEKGKRTPEIKLLTSGEFYISGTSITEDSVAFYQPVMQWIENFAYSISSPLIITIDLEYINTSGTSHIIKLLKYLINNLHKGTGLKIIWKYEDDDDDGLELGSTIQKIIRYPVLMVKK